MPTTTTTSAPLSAGPRALVTSSGCPPGMTPRPIPLVIAGMPVPSTSRQRGLLGAVGPDVGAEDQDRLLRAAQQVGDLLDRVGVRGLAPRTLAGRQAAGGRVVELVHRDVHEHRAAVRGARQGERLVDPAEHVAGRHQCARLLRDGGEDRRLVELLEGTGAPAVLRRPAADDDHRRAGELGLGDRGGAVGDARSRGEHGQPRDAGELAGGLGGERGGLLVPDVEQPHRRLAGSGVDGGVVHREDVGAGEREHRLDPVRASHGHGQLAARGRRSRRSCPADSTDRDDAR